MQVLVSLKFGNGDFANGFSEIALITSIVDSQSPKEKELEIELPPAPQIPGLYQSWQETYIKLFEALGVRILPPRSVATSIDTENENNETFIRGFNKAISANLSPEKSKQECDRYASDLRAEVNQWLEKLKSKLEARLQLNANSQVLLQIHTQNITSQQTKDILHRLPWREWDYFQECSDPEVEVEAILCLSESESRAPEVKDDGIFRRVRITSIFGDSKNINVGSDKELIAKLEKRGAELIDLEEPQRQEFSKLWDRPCDILFYSGHSETSNDGTVGSLQINSEESLNLHEIRNTLGEAVKKGLKLAIFNSCDGLGLAKQLADLRLPYIIVWREPVPDKTAIRFIEYFLSSYAEGKSLFTSVRDARIKLFELSSSEERKKQIPGLNWLPIICKNTSDPPPTWEELGGLTGKLPNCPYKGLSAFTEEDAKYFFGRKSAIADLVQAVDTQPLVGVIGASGSGKSSLVFAGLVPYLRTTGKVEIVSFRPGKNPFNALAIALSSHLQSVIATQGSNPNPTVIATQGSNPNPPVIATQGSNPNPLEISNEYVSPTEVNLRQDKQALCRLIENIVASSEIPSQSPTDAPQSSCTDAPQSSCTDAPQSSCTDAPQSSCRDAPWRVSTADNSSPKSSTKRFVLIADQFEEIYTLTDEEQRQPFLDALLYAVRFTTSFTLVFTLRADFIGKVLDYQPMGEALKQYSPVLLTPMNPEELTAAIEQPAHKMKVEFEKGLTSKLIDDLGTQPGRLPLLEFTLSLLWEKHDRWYLTHEAYEQIGGLEKALAEYANSILNPLSPADKAKAERIFIQLISPGEGTEDTKRKATRAQVGEENWGWVEFFANKRLLVTDRDRTTQEQTVEIIHEALIREWGMLRGWIQSNRQFRIWQERMRSGMYQWQQTQRDEGLLLRGAALAEAQEKLEQRPFDLSSDEQEFIHHSIALRDRLVKEEEERKRLQLQQARRIAWGKSVAGLLLAGVSIFGFFQWQDSQRRIVEAMIQKAELNLASDNQLDAMVEALKAKKSLNNLLIGKNNLSDQVLGSLQQVVYGTQERLRFNNVRGFKFSPDGKQLATGGEDGTVRLWSSSGKELAQLRGHQGPVLMVEFSPGGKQLATGGEDGTVGFWEVGGMEEMVVRTCNWVRAYLNSKPEDDPDRYLCD